MAVSPDTPAPPGTSRTRPVAALGAPASSRAEEVLRTQWEEVFNSTRRGVSVTDARTGIVQQVNAAFATMHGGRPEDFEGRPHTTTLSASWMDRAPALVDEVHAAGFKRLVTEHARLDGTVFPVEAEVVATNGPDGLPLYRIAWFEDLSDRHAVEAAHREASEMLEAAFFNAPNGVAVIGLDARFLRVNAGLCALLGRTEADLVGRSTADCSHPDDMALTRTAYAAMNEASEPIAVEKRYIRPDGSIVWAFCRGIAVRDEDGTPRYFVSHFQDVTARKHAEQEQARATARFEAAFADAPIGMALVGLDGHFLRVNRVLCEITGYADTELVGLTSQELTHPDDLDDDLAHVERLLDGEIERYTIEKRFLTRHEQVIWIRFAGSLVRDPDGRPDYFVAQIEDVSERRRLEDALQHLADHDALTALWNRRRFEEELSHQIGRCRRYDEHAALLMIDLDGFKAVNDRHGHQAGDELLRRVAASLRDRVRTTDALARLGGDEFAVLLLNVTPDQAELLTAKICASVASARLDDAADGVGVTASVGVAFLDAATQGADDAMAIADTAMYGDKATRAG